MCPSLTTVFRRRSMYRYPNVCRPAQSLETGRQNAGDGVLFQIERDRFADDHGISAETTLPQTVADHGNEIPLRYDILSRQERSTQLGGYSECWEIAGADFLGAEPFRFSIAYQIKTNGAVECGVLEDLLILAERFVFGIGPNL